MTCWSLMSSLDFTGWFDFRMEVSDSSPLPCRKDAKIQLQPSTLAENLSICSEDHGIAALSGEVGPSTFLRMLWVLEEQNQHDVTCYKSKRDDKRRSYHGRSMLFRVFNAAPRALTLCQTRATGSLFFQKHQREADDMLKFNVFTGWFDFPMEVSDSSSLPCPNDAKILMHHQTLRTRARLFRRP